MHPPASVEAKDQGRAFEGAKHDRQAAIGAQVGGGLVAAAGLVQIGDGVLAQHPERRAVLGRKIDPPAAAAEAVKNTRWRSMKFR